MKRTIIFLLLFLISEAGVRAQNVRKERYISIPFGLVIPSGDFGVDKFSYNSGFADPGINTGIEYIKYARRFFALHTSLSYSFINFDRAAYKSEYEEIPGLTGTISLKTGNYHLLSGMAGILLKTALNPNIEAIIFADLGYALCLHPEIIVLSSMAGEVNSIPGDSSGKIFERTGLRFFYSLSGERKIGLEYSINHGLFSFTDNTGKEINYFLPVNFHQLSLSYIKLLKR